LTVKSRCGAYDLWSGFLSRSQGGLRHFSAENAHAGCLLIAERQTTAHSLNKIVKSLGLPCHRHVSSYDLALGILEKETPLFIMIDGDRLASLGYRLSQALRAREAQRKTNPIPIFMAVSRLSGHDQEQANASSITAMLLKPLDRAHLLSKLRTALHQHRLTQALTERDAKAAQPPLVNPAAA